MAHSLGQTDGRIRVVRWALPVASSRRSSVVTESEAVNPMSWTQVNQWWRGLVNWAGFSLLPPRCVLCGLEGQTDLDLCRVCEGDIHWNRVACPICALPLAQPASACGVCLKKAPPYASTFAPILYGHPVDALVSGFKFNARMAHGRVMSALLLQAMNDNAADVVSNLAISEPTLLIPVPLHDSRLAERGFNQAQVLAEAINCSYPDQFRLNLKALIRHRATEAQSGLEAAARRRNVRRAFIADDSVVKDRDIVLVDDVITTAATVRECARVLMRAGAKRVRVIALARAAVRV